MVIMIYSHGKGADGQVVVSILHTGEISDLLAILLTDSNKSEGIRVKSDEGFDGEEF